MFLRKGFKNKIFDMQLHGLGLSYTKKSLQMKVSEVLCATVCCSGSGEKFTSSVVLISFLFEPKVGTEKASLLKHHCFLVFFTIRNDAAHLPFYRLPVLKLQVGMLHTFGSNV